MDLSGGSPPPSPSIDMSTVVWALLGVGMAYSDPGELGDPSTWCVHLTWLLVSAWFHYQCFDCLEDCARRELLEMCVKRDVGLVGIKLFFVFGLEPNNLSIACCGFLVLAILIVWQCRHGLITKFIKGKKSPDDATKQCKLEFFFNVYGVVLCLFSYTGNRMFAGIPDKVYRYFGDVCGYFRGLLAHETWSLTAIMVTTLIVLLFSICIMCGSSLLSFINQMWDRKEKQKGGDKRSYDEKMADILDSMEKVTKREQDIKIEHAFRGLRQREAEVDQLASRNQMERLSVLQSPFQSPLQSPLKTPSSVRQLFPQKLQSPLPQPQQHWQGQEVQQQPTDFEQLMIRELAKLTSQLSRVDTIESNVNALYAEITAKTDKKRDASEITQEEEDEITPEGLPEQVQKRAKKGAR